MPRSHSVSILNTGVYSDDDEFRYSLTRCWDSGLARMLLVMHNPSKAREVLNDETVMACQNIAWLIGHPNHRNGVHTEVTARLPCFGAIRVCNLYPAFATSLQEMEMPPPAVLRENDCEIRRACRWADKVVCAWGKPRRVARERCVKRIIRAEVGANHVLHFGSTDDGHPMHPSGVKHLGNDDLYYQADFGNDTVATEEKLLRCLRHWCSFSAQTP